MTAPIRHPGHGVPRARTGVAVGSFAVVAMVVSTWLATRPGAAQAQEAMVPWVPWWPRS
jgi:hypothetical protein